MYPLAANDFVTRIRRRIEDTGGRNFTDAQLLDVIDEVMASDIMTGARMFASDREVTPLEVTTATDLVAVPGGAEWSYQLPETVLSIRHIEAEASPSRMVTVFKANLEYRHAMQQVAWHFAGDRPGEIRFTGAITPYAKLRIWFVRSWVPMHYGTAQGATGQDKIQFAASATGRVIQRAGLYEGIDVLITNDQPSGNQDALRRITSYAGGSTREATVASNWPATPTSSTTYSLVVPLMTPELVSFAIEAVARQCFNMLGEAPPMPVYHELKAQIEEAVSERGGMQNIWNYGR